MLYCYRTTGFLGNGAPMLQPVPLSLTDLASSVQKFIDTLRAVGEFTADAVELFKCWRERKVGSNFTVLHFSKTGMLPYIQRMAEGTASADDIDALERALTEGEGAVEKSLQALQPHRASIAERFGLEIADALDGILNGPTGKRMIRYNIKNLIAESRKPKPDLDGVRRSAQAASESIRQLNAQLVELHKLLVRPKHLKKI